MTKTQAMADAKHTPGPWTIEGRIHSSGEAVRIQGMDSFGAHGYNVADVIVANGDPQNDANARLIAAAPELLDCLEWVLKTHSMCADESARIRAAIAKATGSTE